MTFSVDHKVTEQELETLNSRIAAFIERHEMQDAIVDENPNDLFSQVEYFLDDQIEYGYNPVYWNSKRRLFRAIAKRVLGGYYQIAHGYVGHSV